MTPPGIECSTHEGADGGEVGALAGPLSLVPFSILEKENGDQQGQKALKEHFLNLLVAVTPVGATGFEPATS
jgi:hypothetical protein